MAPLTMEEFLQLNPAKTPPPPVMAAFLRYRHIYDKMAPTFTALVEQKAERLRAKGFNIPDRFLPRVAETVSPERLRKIVADVYRGYLRERMQQAA